MTIIVSADFNFFEKMATIMAHFHCQQALETYNVIFSLSLTGTFVQNSTKKQKHISHFLNLFIFGEKIN